MTPPVPAGGAGRHRLSVLSNTSPGGGPAGMRAAQPPGPDPAAVLRSRGYAEVSGHSFSDVLYSGQDAMGPLIAQSAGTRWGRWCRW
jgi:hypothetical protein